MTAELKVYLPDGDVGYGQATETNVAALLEANYQVDVIDDMGHPDPTTTVAEVIRFAQTA